MLGQLGGEDQTNSGGDLAGTEGALLGGAGNLGSAGGDAVEDVVHEAIEDLHGLAGQGQALVDLLEGAVDIDGPGALGLAVGLLGSGTGGLLGHFDLWSADLSYK